ncbi:hypothetical protein [Piscirickettsia litoralis]|uniref:Peptidase C80 domain-containing protein n=1 Tax=Piscirickettsia litoralis TaxID=1891921 RepID=A0ABX2ZZI1_9GAMM|nr:hypothetical protein [Piscirickettsia litoralis]ODN41989.1 hypothetical protein BGC07_02215 [Piscirickettsia litoralis]
MKFLYIPFKGKEVVTAEFFKSMQGDDEDGINEDLLLSAMTWKHSHEKIKNKNDMKIVCHGEESLPLQAVDSSDVIYVLAHGINGSVNLIANSNENPEETNVCAMSIKLLVSRLKADGLPSDSACRIKLFFLW